MVNKSIKTGKRIGISLNKERVNGMTIKGYNVPNGYMGWIEEQKYMLFASEQDYLEYIKDSED